MFHALAINYAVSYKSLSVSRVPHEYVYLRAICIALISHYMLSTLPVVELLNDFN